jgi:hypothetical protein
LWLSKPEVGSSNINKSGSDIISTAIQTLFFYPPEIPFTIWPPTNVSWHFCSSNVAII